MSYTFGAATADDITLTAGSSTGGNGIEGFVCGWWYPTTLTATRGYWSAGNTFGAEVDTTTSEIRLRTDNTTDGQWTTSGLGITTNKWWFLAFLYTCTNTGPAAAWRVWVGDELNRPVVQTPAVAVAAAGNFTGSTSRTVGNKGTGTLAFQGDIGWFLSLSIAGSSVTKSPFGISANGVLGADQEQRTESRFVMPLWGGQFPIANFAAGSTTLAFSAVHLPLDQPGNTGYQWSSSTTLGPLALTTNGATYTSNAPPIILKTGALFHPPLMRR